MLAVAEGVDVPDRAALALAQGCLQTAALAVEVLQAEPGERRLWAAIRLAEVLTGALSAAKQAGKAGAR